MKRIILSVMVLMLSITAFSQEGFGPGGGSNVLGPANMAEVLPSAPDAANFMTQSMNSASLFTGRASATIPMYEIKIGNISVPVSLNYSTSGFKPDDMPGRQGLGWTLGCDGVVTRSVLGKPDDGSGIIRVSQPAPTNPTDFAAMAAFFNSIATPGGNADAEADEFSVSAPGLESFKFLIKDNGEIIQFPYTNNKVEIFKQPANSGPYNQIIVTSASGIRYEFGGTGALEKTVSHNFSGRLKNFSQIRTSFFIKKIILPDGNYVLFNYTSFISLVSTGMSESVSRGEGNESNICNGITNICPGVVPQTTSYSKTISRVNYSTAGISSIQASNGQSVSFTYGFIPPNEDGNTADCLTTVQVNSGDYLRTYHLDYLTPATIDGSTGAEGLLNPRFFLNKVSYTDPETNFDIGYQLEYNNISELPMRLSYAKDHLGYYNGVNTNFSLLPDLPGDVWVPFENANRNFYSSNAIKGTLNKITYPTGGTEKINYEPNTVAKEEGIHDWVTAGAGGVAPGSALNTTFSSASFHVYKSQNVTVYLTSNDTPDPNHIIGLISGSLIDLSTNAPYGDNLYITISGNTTSQTYALTPGDYQLTTTIKANHGGDISMLYDAAAPGSQWINYESGGIRVSSVERYDPLTQKSNNKFYKYAGKDHPDRSSGETDFYAEYLESAAKVKVCPSQPTQADPFMTCDLFIFSSNSQTPSLTFPDFMRYKYVIESDDPNFTNGSILHEFNTEHQTGITYVNNFPIRDVPAGEITNPFGKETVTTWYDQSFNPVKKVEYNYELAPNYMKEYTGHCIRYTFPYDNGYSLVPAWNPLHIFSYDQTDYAYQSRWLRLNSTVTTEYANGIASANTETYSYNELPASAPVNTGMVKLETHDSKGQLFSTEVKYPTEYSDPVSLSMIAKNMITDVINTKQKRGGNEISSSTTVYKDWGTMIKPEIVKYSLNGNPEENRIRYYGYDAKGNPLQMSKENDVKLSYLWGYGRNFPVAEINTDQQVRYSSFEEADEQSPWTGINQSYVITAADAAMTGKKYYQQNGFDLSAGSLAGNYTVTYWTDQSAAYTVTGTLSGWPKLLRTVVHGSSTWRLYEHRCNAATIHVTGSGAIDELRAYPQGASMKTFTYLPYVGISSQCDESNNISYFEYDGLGRLHLVRDIERNIIKKICYNYAGQPESCGLQKFYSVVQQGSFTPTNCPPNSTANVVVFTIAANTYSSVISQQDANQQAINALNAGGQAYANTNPSCTTLPPPVCVPGNCASGHCNNGVCDNGAMHLTGYIRRKVMVEGQWIWRYTCYWTLCYADGTTVPQNDTESDNDPCGIVNNVCP